MRPILSAVLVMAVASAGVAFGRSGPPLVIAHRGASGYLPEHTLEAKALAYAQRPDFIEQDVALTKDGVPVVMHDHYLDTVTDVATVYPARKRPDGRYYVIDFTRDELARLTVHERTDLASGRQVYPRRFPLTARVPFRIPTLDDELSLIEGLNRSTGGKVGIYVELKAPWFHEREGQDIAALTLAVLARHGYAARESNAWLQCFDPACLKRLRNELKTKLRLVQLIGENAWNETPGVDYQAMLTPEGLRAVARYADGIGPFIPQLVRVDQAGCARPNGVVAAAHRAGLVVHPYTIRLDELPPFAPTLDALMELLFRRCGVDGAFTDFPDQVVDGLRRRHLRD